MTNQEFLTNEQAAEYLGVTVATLNVWRSTKKYNIPFYKAGKNIRYKLTDLKQFIESTRKIYE
jgi:excisionase family DNA binding protein